jgi:hypothetical protein
VTAEFGVKLVPRLESFLPYDQVRMLGDDPGWYILCSTSDRTQPAGLSSFVGMLTMGSIIYSDCLATDICEYS